MKTTEYKIEVSSLKLSESFKEELKQKMLAEAEKTLSEPAEQKPSIVKSYSKYIALAACLLIAISAVGFMSLGGKIESKSADNASAENDTVQNAADANGFADGEILNSVINDEIEAPAEGAEDGADMEAEDYADMEAEAVEEVESVEEALDAPVESGEEETEKLLSAEPTESEQEDEIISETNPMSGNGFSPEGSRDYDGNYNGADYVYVGGEGSAAYSAALVKNDLTGAEISFGTVTAQTLESEPVDIQVDITESETESTETEIPSAYGDGDAVYFGDDSEEFVPDAVEAPEPADAEEILEAEQIFDYNSLNYEYSMEYYDVRDGIIADLDKIGLIKFEILESYDTEDAVAMYIGRDIDIDTDTRTLYSVNVNYVYFESEEVGVERALINVGTAQVQLVGRPLMEGEYVAVVYENSDGILEPVPQLLYAVHKVRGVDIAYHVYCPDGFMVDPGSTNMGLMPEEYEVVTSTDNNPEIYTQKAAVSELTHYLRRNILRMEPTLIDFSKKSVPKTSANVNYPTGMLALENDKINGVAVGDSLDDSLAALYLSDYSFAPDCVLTLNASEEQGGWYVVVTVKDGVIVSIEPHIEND